MLFRIKIDLFTMKEEHIEIISHVRLGIFLSQIGISHLLFPLQKIIFYLLLSTHFSFFGRLNIFIFPLKIVSLGR